ncbi:MAG: gliding motility-associated ABC transporter permease subunit GldF [Catalinimonas sp.]
MWAILRKEFNGFLNSLIAYVVIGVFLVATGIFTWVIPETSVLTGGYADLGPLFSLAPYLFLFLIPAVTMRAFAEERRTGTMELLLTKPLTDGQIVVGKYLACWLLVVLALLPTGLYYWTVYQLGEPAGNVDTAAVVGSYVGLLLLGAVFTSIGLLASALTDNQIVAFVVSVFLCFVFYQGFSTLASIDAWGQAARLIDQLGIAYHYDALSRGLIDSRDVVYFLSVIAFMLLTARLVLGSRKW